MRVADLRLSDKKIALRVLVLEISPTRSFPVVSDDRVHRVSKALVGDETGSIWLSLWDDAIDQVRVGKTIDLENAYTTLYKNALFLNIGRFGRIRESAVPIEKTNLKNNLSEKELPSFSSWTAGKES